jgi:hypothetical protein
MLKVLSIVFHVIAGFLFSVVSVMAFFSGLPGVAKVLILAGTSLPGLIALGIGLAFTRFRHWKRDAGVVLLSTSACNVVMIVTIACMLMSDEFLNMFPESASMPVNDYFTGFIVMVVLALVGWLLFKSGETARQDLAIT